MGRISKSFVLILILIMIISGLSVMIVKPANAQSIPKPSVPEFTLSILSHPYDVAPTTTIDPFTGKTVTTQAGYHVENKSIEITIKNQPFTAFTDKSGNYINLYYNVSYKGPYGTDWNYYSYDSLTKYFVTQSDSDYTTISFSQIPTEGQMDFRLQALIGFYTETGHPFMDVYEYNFTGQTSDWSSTQTITIQESNSSPSPTSSVPEFPIIAILPLFLSAFSAAIILRHRKTASKPKT